MNISIAVSPGKHLSLIEDPESQPEIGGAAAARLNDAFGRSASDGLRLLASRELDQELPASLVFWRGFARRFFQAICQLGERGFEEWKSAPPPDGEQLDRFVAEAPPMRGLEYLDADVLRALWQELREQVARDAAKHRDGPAAFLRELNPLWHLLGRVTFHLAENKRTPERPFAFLATYTHGLSGPARLQHLPLADALKTYAAAKDREKLESLLEPVKYAAERSPLVAEMLSSKSLFAPQAWTIQQAYRFLKESPRIEEAGVVVRLPDWWSHRRPPRPQVQVQIGKRPASILGMDEMLDFQVGLALDGEPLTDAERARLLAGTEGLVLLRGKWVEVDREKLEQAIGHWKRLQARHPDGVSFIEGMRLLSGTRLEAQTALDDEVASWSRITAGDWLRQTLEQMQRPEHAADCEPGRDLAATLRPYQADGVRWLWFMTKLGLGACLADDMGLGKTVQMIDLLLQRKRQFKQAPLASASSQPAEASANEPSHQPNAPARGKHHALAGDRDEGPSPALRASVRSPALLVVPASLVGNWKQEIARFGPSLMTCFLHRSECDADTLARIANEPRRELAAYDLVVTTYGLARRQEWLEQVPWSLVVLDEAQAIKNASSAQTRSVKKLTAPARVVLTGTPVENHLGDLWSIFDFCCPGLLGSAGQFKEFVKRLNKQQDAAAFGALRRLVRPYILRRMKTDPAIVPDLPDKTEMRTECGLSKKQAVLYERAVSDLADRLKTADGIARRGLVLAFLMQLKQICNHPAQFLAGTAFTPADSGKFERLKLLCEPIIERQEKMLVFTQFQSLTDPLAAYLATVFGRPGLVLHGGTPVRKRMELVRHFQSDDGPPFFVISLKAGGSGLNLTAASHVVHFDRWWNPAVENQATDRAFRIGQKRNVLVHKFVCRGTVEERIDEMIRHKQSLADRLLNQAGETMLTELSNDELLRFVSLDISRAVVDE